MKILIVSTSDTTGGAAIAASRLAEALSDSGQEVTLLVAKKKGRLPYTAECAPRLSTLWHFLYERVTIWLRNGFSKKNLFKVSIANSGTDITRTRLFREADIIHLHWVQQGMLSLGNIQAILDSGKPVVWTMHDMWPVTSICHHSLGCQGYTRQCGRCPLLRFPSEGDLSARVFSRKKAMLQGRQRPTLVAVGAWLAGCSRASAITGGLPLRVIPNALSLSRFTMHSRGEARKSLGISEPYVVAFGAARIDDPIKGFTLFIEALRRLTGPGGFAPGEVRLLLFGTIRDHSLLTTLPVPHSFLGYVADSERLSLIYSASNATVSTSAYETFGQTLVEAQCCGSLPVAVGGTGPDDIISHRKTGFLASERTPDTIAEGIAWALRATPDAEELRRSVVGRFSAEAVARQYIELYNELSNPTR